MILNILGMLLGGMVNRYVFARWSPKLLLTFSIMQVWETAQRAGLITANLMWSVANVDKLHSQTYELHSLTGPDLRSPGMGPVPHISFLLK